jgi:glyceraldehyde 3-phosphate dehydrogenase
MNAHLLEFDTVHGRISAAIEAGEEWMRVNGRDIKVTSELVPEKLPWRELGVDIVMECTGRFTKREDAAHHLAAGAKRVLVSAPADKADLTVVCGVNDDKLTGHHVVVSNASCTTNCLAPVAKGLHEAIGIERGFMTTIYSYTGDQRTVDTFHNDAYRARAAAANLIPTTTGAARAVGLVLPEPKGKLDGTAVRVPTLNVSLIDLKFSSTHPANAKAINEAMIDASRGGWLKGVLSVNDRPLVSGDFNHNPASSVFDVSGTQVVDGVFSRVMSWYDNEWGFSNRMIDTAAAMGSMM